MPGAEVIVVNYKTRVIFINRVVCQMRISVFEVASLGLSEFLLN